MKRILSQKSVLFFLAAFLLSNLVFAQNNFPSSGNVGINTGTSASTAKFQLDVNGAVAMGGQANNLDPGNSYAANLPNLVGTGKCLVGWNRSAGWGETDLITNTLSGLGGGFIFWNMNSSGTISPLVFMSASTGNVLIGNLYQTNTAYKLDVSGPMRANEVVVNTTGADYVFDTAYRLVPLPDVSNYIHTFHHLPGIAPAKEMQEQGMKLGENQTQLLQKIEELTLYIVDQDKKVAALQQENKDLKENLQAQIDELKAMLRK
jgi:hypothetical protein